MADILVVKSAKQEAEEDLLQRKGVTGVGVGYKYVRGQRTDETAIQVFVQEKRDVRGEERIPKTINGVKTDVIQRRFVPFQRRVKLAEVKPQADTATYDPLQGGISFGPCRPVGGCIFVGTLGAIVRDNATGDPMALSNFHVMCVDNNWTAGDTLAQPGRVDGGNCPANVVAELRRASLGGRVDGAVARITARGHRCSIVDIGDVAGTATATLGMAVRKRGRTTGLTFGTVDSIDLSVRVNYDDADCGITGVGEIVFTDQIGINVDTVRSTRFGIGGDSGSVIVNDERNIVGLYFAGNLEERDAAGNVITPEGVFGVANPIQAVLDTLEVSICVPTPKSLLKDFKDGKHESKEFKREKLEKLEWKEGKHEKLEKLEWKEGKREKLEKPEGKEIKEPKEFKEPKELKEFKEPKEFKESGKDFKEPKEIFEQPPGPGQPPSPFQQAVSPTSIEERLARLETALNLTPTGITPQARNCVDFGSLPPGLGPNPRIAGGFTITVRDYAGAVPPSSRVVQWGAFTGLDCGFTTEITHHPCRSVEVTLVHFARPATVEAYNASGMLVSTASMSGPQQLIETLMLTGQGITRVIIRAPQNETLLLRYCCEPDKPLKEKPEKREKPEKPEWKDFKEPKELKDGAKDFKEPKELKDGAKDFKEPKELKDGAKDFKEPKELKDGAKDLKEPKEIIEGIPGQPGQPTGMYSMMGDIEARLARLEAALLQQSHFIDPSLRPDLSTGALSQETDLESVDPQLRKGTKENKDDKDGKDSREKPAEA